MGPRAPGDGYGSVRVGARARYEPGGARRRPGRAGRARRAQAPIRAGGAGHAARQRRLPRRPGRPRLGRATRRGGAHGTLHSYVSGRTPRPRTGSGAAAEAERAAHQRPRLPARPAAASRSTPTGSPTRSAPVAAPWRPLATQFTTGPSPDWPDRATISDHVDALEELLALWTGEAYADLPDHPEVALERSALDQLRRGAEEDRVLGLLALGDHAVVVAATEQATARHSLEERIWALHALALARSGRQAESLAALRHIRRVLADELGLDPGQELRDLEQAVLAQDPVLQQWLRPDGDAGTPDPVVAAAPPDAPAPDGMGHWSAATREVAELERVLDRAAAGEPAYALLVGEPGIGKSRLVERTRGPRRRAGVPRGHRPVRPGRRSTAAVAVEPGPRRPRASGRPAPLDSEVERLLSGDARTPTTSPRARSGRRSGPGRASRTRSWPARGRRPLLLVLEDLHWADTASLRVLRRLVASTAPGQRLALRRHPTPVAGADRGTGRGRRGARAAARGPARPRRPERGRGRLAGRRGDRRAPPTPTSSPSWHDRSEGNPFFLIELARLGADPAQGDAVPATVRDVIARRFETLPEQTRSLLLLAAVLGRRCSLDVLAAVAEESVDDVDDLLAPAREAGLVRRAGGRDGGLHARPDARRRGRHDHRLAGRPAPCPGGPRPLRRRSGGRPGGSRGAGRRAGPALARRGSVVRRPRLACRRRRRRAGPPDLLLGGGRAADGGGHRGTPARPARHRRRSGSTCCSPGPATAGRTRSGTRCSRAPRRRSRSPAARRTCPGWSPRRRLRRDNLVWTSQQWNEVLEDTVDDLRWALARTSTARLAPSGAG